VTVFTFDWDLAPAAGMVVAVNDAAGAVVDVQVTGSSGTVEVAVPEGGLVAMYPPEQAHERTAQMVVMPPDGATVFLHSLVEPPNQQMTIYDVTATGYPAESVEIDVHVCYEMVAAAADAGGSTLVLANDGHCRSPEHNTVIAVAYDATQAPLAWGRADVSASPGAHVPVQVALDQVAFRTFTSTISPIPPEATYAMIMLGSSAIDAPWFQYLEGVASPGPEQSWSYTIPDVLLPFGLYEGVIVSEGNQQRELWLSNWYDSLPDATSFDPTDLAAVMADPLDTSDLAHPVATWSVGAGVAGEAVRLGVTAHFDFAGDVSVDAFAPAGLVTSFRVPDIPIEVPHFALDGANGLADSWHFFVSSLDDGMATSWPELYLFEDPAAASFSLRGSAMSQ
jgi:hypothetical protein